MRRLRRPPEAVVWAAIAAAAAAVALAPFTGLSIYAMSVAFTVMFHASLATGWNILGGYAGYESFGHVAFVGAGGYTTALLLSRLGWSPLVTAPAAALVAMAIALVVGYPCLRLRGPFFALVTLVVSLAVTVVVVNLPGLGAAAGIFVPRPAGSPVMSRLVLYEAMAAILLLTVVAARAVERSRFGVGLRAIREDEEVAATQGVPTTGLKLAAFSLSAALAGLAGGIFSWSRGFLDPGEMFSVSLSVLVVLFALFGGRRSWVGPVVGAVVVTLAREGLFLFIGEQAAQILFGVLLVAVILFLPNGIIGARPRLLVGGQRP
jgi:branched-chain amino acid transport system permease protein